MTSERFFKVKVMTFQQEENVKSSKLLGQIHFVKRCDILEN